MPDKSPSEESKGKRRSTKIVREEQQCQQGKSG